MLFPVHAGRNYQSVLLFHFFCIFANSNRGVAQLASVLAWGASGRPFESDRSDRQVVSNGNLFLYNLKTLCILQSENVWQRHNIPPFGVELTLGKEDLTQNTEPLWQLRQVSCSFLHDGSKSSRSLCSSAAFGRWNVVNGLFWRVHPSKILVRIKYCGMNS